MASRKLVPGLYEEVISEPLRNELSAADTLRLAIETGAVDQAEAPAVLARYLHDQLVRSLRDKRDPGQQLALANRVLELIAAAPVAPDAQGRAEQLLSVLERRPEAPGASAPVRPGIPLASSALLVNAVGEHGVGHEIGREIASADDVALLCSFVKWSGFRLVRDVLRELVARGGKLRVLTTVYMGATQKRALDALAELGASVRISYNTERTRLHAKAWLFQRHTGFDTAYVGSSNLSSAALVDGVEWNVRLSRVDAPGLLDKFAGTFESYWQDPGFEPYEPERDGGRLQGALERAAGVSPASILSGLAVRPYPHQQEILDRLEAERALHGRWRNLVVAATGTGKTVIAALDYRRVRPHLPSGSLLFVAHRREILEQSQRCFREVLSDGAFGEMWVSGERPARGEHVFASVQTLTRIAIDGISPERWDAVIIDEFHHAAAPIYERLLAHLRPKLLLGLTATPERADGQSVLDWFGGHTAAELRLWTALEQGLLVPFQYFGVHDPVGLDAVEWKRGHYDPVQIENLYTGNDARARLVLREVADRVEDPAKMRALGFCVGIRHAQFMARKFTEAGLPAAAVTGDTGESERDAALRDLRDGRLCAVFSVDVFNEGVDLPTVDTVLFLRPTESATVFLQQLGRGLRLAPGKECLTVLDFIGNAHRRFRFDRRYRALLGPGAGSVLQAVQHGFPLLPPGSALRLDRGAQEVVVRNIREQLRSGREAFVAEARDAGPDITLAELLRRADLAPAGLYRRPGDSWTAIRRAAGLPWPASGPEEEPLLRAMHRLVHIDDAERLDSWRDTLAGLGAVDATRLAVRDQRRLWMLHFLLWGRSNDGPQTLAASLERLERNPAVVAELRALLDLLRELRDHVVHPLPGFPEVPLQVHAHYAQDEVLVAFGATDRSVLASFREGVRYERDANTDLLFVTLEKSDKDYSPTTMYRDYAISAELFHWESQSTTGADSPKGRRYRDGSSRVLLFVRRTKKDERGATAPHVFLGPARYVGHQGDRPMAITWRLDAPIPAAFLEETRLTAG